MNSIIDSDLYSLPLVANLTIQLISQKDKLAELGIQCKSYKQFSLQALDLIDACVAAIYKEPNRAEELKECIKVVEKGKNLPSHVDIGTASIL